jgi:hypothetical protein
LRAALVAWFDVQLAAVTTILFLRQRRALEGPDRDEIDEVFR